MSSRPRTRLFHLHENQIDEILFCDNSDTEECFQLDDEDFGFLEDDLEKLESKTENADPFEVIIESSENAQVKTKSDEQLHSLEHSDLHERSSSSKSSLEFQWKKLDNLTSSYNQDQELSSRLTHQNKDFNFGEVLLQISSNPTPLEVFNGVAGFEDFLNKIVIPQTLLYSQQQAHVLSTDVDEIKALFGMHIVMGYHRLPCLRDYWSTEPDLSVPFISNIMPRRRFEELRAFVHFNDNTLMKPRDHPDHDRAFKVRLVLNHFNEHFLSALKPTQHQSIDEHMVKFKGHNILKQYVKGKPIQWGFKLWCRCDSKTGYLFEGDLYCGKKVGFVEHGLGEGVVLQLTQKIESLGCQVFIDNFFNSPALQKLLSEKGILSAGTVRANRKHMPKSDVPSDKSIKRGDVVSFQSDGITLVKWMDNKGVFMLSNFLFAQPEHCIWRRKKGSREKETVMCPDVVRQYNCHMGGVDLMDQKKETYQFDNRSKLKYYLRLVFDLIDIAINNSYVVWTKLEDGFQNIQTVYSPRIDRKLQQQKACSFTHINSDTE